MAVWEKFFFWDEWDQISSSSSPCYVHQTPSRPPSLRLMSMCPGCVRWRRLIENFHACMDKSKSSSVVWGDIINQKLKWKITYDTASDTLRRKHFCIHAALLDMIWRHWNAIASHFSRRLVGFFSRFFLFLCALARLVERAEQQKRSRRTISVQRVHLSLQIWYVQQHRERQARGAKKNVQETRIFNMKMTFYVFNDDRVVVIVRRTAAAAIVHRRRSIEERWAGVCEMWNW